MSNLLNTLDELDNYLFSGGQKTERRVCCYISSILFSMGLSLDQKYVKPHPPHVIRNISVNLKEEHAKKVFPILANQDSTELDALFINSPSYLGHSTNLSYYIEIET